MNKTLLRPTYLLPGQLEDLIGPVELYFRMDVTSFFQPTSYALSIIYISFYCYLNTPLFDFRKRGPLKINEALRRKKNIKEPVGLYESEHFYFYLENTLGARRRRIRLCCFGHETGIFLTM